MPGLPPRHERPTLPLRSASLFPERALRVYFWHPGTDRPFLSLPANDNSDVPNVFGLHHGTALLACQVLAFNEPGYLSTSRDPKDVSSRHDGGRDSLLLHRKYYYFLLISDLHYDICEQFSEWPFPHDWYEEVWGSGDVKTGVEGELHSSGASVSIELRDKVCAISGCNDSLTMLQLVPRAEADWLDDNSMDVYMAHNIPLDLDPTNLLAMRGDLHHEQFEQGTFAIVPKCGELRVHFLTYVRNAANYYHNTVFEHEYVSRQLLFARFAMQIIKSAQAGGYHAGDKRRGGSSAYGHGGDVGNGGGGRGSIGGYGGGDCECVVDDGEGGGSGDVGDDGGGSGGVENRSRKRKRGSGKMKERLAGTMEDSGSKKSRKKVVKASSATKRMETEGELETDTERDRAELRDMETGSPLERYMRRNPQVQAHNSEVESESERGFDFQSD